MNTCFITKRGVNATSTTASTCDANDCNNGNDGNDCNEANDCNDGNDSSDCSDECNRSIRAIVFDGILTLLLLCYVRSMSITHSPLSPLLSSIYTVYIFNTTTLLTTTTSRTVRY